MPNLCDYGVLRIIHRYEKVDAAGGCRKLLNISEIKEKFSPRFFKYVMRRNVKPANRKAKKIRSQNVLGKSINFELSV
jgi:hypothetical protein